MGEEANGVQHARIEVAFTLASNTAVIVDADGSTSANLSGHLDRYSGRTLGTAYHPNSNVVAATSRLRGAAPLIASLSLAPPQDYVSLDAMLEGGPLAALKFFENTMIYYHDGRPYVAQSPSVQVCLGLGLPTVAASFHLITKIGGPTGTSIWHVRYTWAKLTAAGLGCRVEGNVVVHIARCPDQRLANNCNIRGWAPLPPPPRKRH
jgi:hypothetical protein